MDDNQGANPEVIQDESVARTEQIIEDGREEAPNETMPVSEEKRADEVDEKTALENSKNPERTAAYIEKLKEENRRLKESRGIQETSVFDSFRPTAPQVQTMPNLNQNQISAITDQFVDAEGNVDVAGLNNALMLASQRAAQAEQRAQMTEEKVMRLEETRQVREAHATYPELDPSSEKFDPIFYDAVKDRVLRNMYEGKNQELLNVAKDIRKFYQPTVDVSKAKTEAVKEFKESQAKKETGPIESGRGETRHTSGELDSLRERTRQGDPRAISQRLKALGI